MRSTFPCKARGTTFCAAGKLVKQSWEASSAGVLGTTQMHTADLDRFFRFYKQSDMLP